MPATLSPPSRLTTSLTPRVPLAAVRGNLAVDDAEFHVIEDVPVFPEHQTKAKDGRWLVFDYTALKAVCDSCNRRILLTGDYAAITIGHTDDPALVREGRAKNPEIVGFAGPFKMGLLGNQPGFQRWCILARFRIFRDRWAEARQYPRRSPELWLMPTYDQMFLDPIALLGAETPRLDMGLLYSAVLHAEGVNGVLVDKYAAAAAVAPAAGNVFAPSERYQGEKQMANSADEIVQAVVGALDSLDWVQWVKTKMMQDTSPAALGTAPAADVTAPPPAMDPAAAAAATAVPEPVPAGDAPLTPPPAAAAPPAAPAAPPAAPPAAAPPAAGPPPVEGRSQAEPEKDTASVPRVRYQADGKDDDKDDKPKEGDEPEVLEAPEGVLVPDDDDDDDDDPEPEENESVEQYRARSRDHRRRRRSKVKYSLDAEGLGSLKAIVAEAVGPLAAQVETIQTEIARDRVGMKNIERYARLEALPRQGYSIDPSELIDKLRYTADGKGVSDEEFERSLSLLMKTGNRAPIDAPLLPVPDSVEQYSAQPGDAKAATADQRDTTRSLCEKAAIEGQRPDYTGTLRNVVSGKNEVALL